MPVSGDKIVRGTTLDTLYEHPGPFIPNTDYPTSTITKYVVAENISVSWDSLIPTSVSLYNWDGSSWVFVTAMSNGVFYEKSVGAYPEFKVVLVFPGFHTNAGGVPFPHFYIRRKPKTSAGTTNKVYYYNHSTTVSDSTRVDSAYKTNRGVKITPALQLNMTD